MKIIFSAIAVAFCLARTTIANDETCEVKCAIENEPAGNYTGEKSLYVRLGPNTEKAFCIKTKVYGAYSVKYGLAFALNGKFVAIISIKTGVYILLDHKTHLAVHGKTKITFLTSSNKVDYEKFLIQSNEILQQYTCISTDTKDSFDFDLIVNAIYSSQNFDLKSILGGEKLATVLQENFSGWFALVQTQVKKGSITISRSYWGLLAVIYVDPPISDTLLIMDVFKVTIAHYHEIKTEIIVHVTNAVLSSIESYRKTATKIAVLGLILGEVDIKVFIEALENPQYDSTDYEITDGEIRYVINVYRIESSFIILFTIVVNNITISYKVIGVQSVLYIVNMQTNIVLALQGSSALVANRTSGLVIVADVSKNLKVKISACNNVTFIQQMKDMKGVEVTEQVLVYIQENKSSGHESNLQAFIEAVIKGHVKQIEKLIGSAELAAGIITSFKVFLTAVKISATGKLSLSAVGSGAFGNEVKLNIIVKTVVQVLTNILSKGEDFSTFLAAFIKDVVANGGTTKSG